MITYTRRVIGPHLTLTPDTMLRLRRDRDGFHWITGLDGGPHLIQAYARTIRRPHDMAYGLYRQEDTPNQVWAATPDGLSPLILTPAIPLHATPPIGCISLRIPWPDTSGW